tara:strand:+ start:589 stop:855 length:267 start_codon:yes stop_codon:yes gene_type:complete
MKMFRITKTEANWISALERGTDTTEAFSCREGIEVIRATGKKNGLPFLYVPNVAKLSFILRKHQDYVVEYQKGTHGRKYWVNIGGEEE